MTTKRPFAETWHDFFLRYEKYKTVIRVLPGVFDESIKRARAKKWRDKETLDDIEVLKTAFEDEDDPVKLGQMIAGRSFPSPPVIAVNFYFATSFPSEEELFKFIITHQLFSTQSSVASVTISGLSFGVSPTPMAYDRQAQVL
jgi:hypothetical protein